MSTFGKMAYVVLAVVLSRPFPLPAQTVATVPVPAHIVVTIGHHYGHEPPVLAENDLSVINSAYEPLTVTGLVPLRADRAALELFILVDNCSSCEASSKFQELSSFIRSQPATTKIGVAYITNGKLTVAEAPTADRARAIRALNTPSGSAPASPFDALAQLLGTWRTTSARQAVVMVTNGMNPDAQPKQQDPSAESAIEAAQRAGVTVYAIYHPSADYASADVSRLYDGQVQLAHVGHDTGGEAYFLGFGPLPSIAPFLADIADHLSNQYLLEFMAIPAAGTGPLQEVTVKVREPDLEIMVPERAWVGSVAAAQP